MEYTVAWGDSVQCIALFTFEYEVGGYLACQEPEEAPRSHSRDCRNFLRSENVQGSQVDPYFPSI